MTPLEKKTIDHVIGILSSINIYRMPCYPTEEIPTPKLIPAEKYVKIWEEQGTKILLNESKIREANDWLQTLINKTEK